jgi:integrative and conjugative element protein (TIGR02256 family)
MSVSLLGFNMARKQHPVILEPHYERVYIVESAVRDIAQECERKPGVETGGVLVGFVDSGLHAVVVTAVSGPGPHAHHGATTFNRDPVFCQAFLDHHVLMTNGLVDFVGEWHKHREPDPWPSSVDINTYRKLALDPRCHLALPLVLIAGTTTDARSPRVDHYVQVKAFVFRVDGFIHRPVRPLPDEAYRDVSLPLILPDSDV